MNEAETRAEYIDPKLKESGWGEVGESKILREFRITDGRIQAGGIRGRQENRFSTIQKQTFTLDARDNVLLEVISKDVDKTAIYKFINETFDEMVYFLD